MRCVLRAAYIIRVEGAEFEKCDLFDKCVLYKCDLFQ